MCHFSSVGVAQYLGGDQYHGGVLRNDNTADILEDRDWWKKSNNI